MDNHKLNIQNQNETESYLELLTYIISYPASKQSTPYLLITL